MTRRTSQAPHDDISLPAQNKVDVIAEQANFWSALKTMPHGFAYMEGHRAKAAADGLTSIWFVWQGREYIRTYERFYSSQWAGRLATQFARDVVEGRVGK